MPVCGTCMGLDPRQPAAWKCWFFSSLGMLWQRDVELCKLYSIHVEKLPLCSTDVSSRFVSTYAILQQGYGAMQFVK